METGRPSGRTAPQPPGGDTRPVILVLVEDTVGSLASLLFAADIAVARQARLRIVHVRSPQLLCVGMTGILLPTAQWAEADRLAADQLREKIASLLALASVGWTFTVASGSVHHTVIRRQDALAGARQTGPRELRGNEVIGDLFDSP